MRMLNEPYALNEIEELLESEIKSDKKHIRILGDLSFTYEDYKYLTLKLKGLMKYKDNMELLNKYKLCMITSWVFALRFEKSEKIALENIRSKVKKCQQHHIRYILKVFVSAFEEYGLNMFGCDDIENIEELFMLTAIHSGIPDDLVSEFYELIEKSINYGEMKELEHDIWGKLSHNVAEVYEYVDSEYKRKLIYCCREMYIECRNHHYSEEQLLEKYLSVSYKLVKGCVKKCNEIEDEMEDEIKKS